MTNSYRSISYSCIGTILVTVLKILLPEEVLPSVGVIVSVIVLPATSVPVTVKPVDDKSPPSKL